MIYIFYHSNMNSGIGNLKKITIHQNDESSVKKLPIKIEEYGSSLGGTNRKIDISSLWQTIYAYKVHKFERII